MTESWFHRLEGEVQRAAGHFRHAGNTITRDATQPATPQEPALALADTSASLQDTSVSLRQSLEASASALREALDNHATRLEADIRDVAAVASIADHPLVVAAAGALHVPPPVLEGFISGLKALAAAFPKQAPEEAPVEVPADPQPEPAEQAA